MKMLLSTVLTLSVMMALPAAAGQWRGHGGGGMNVQMQQPGRYQRQPQRQPERQPQRDFQRQDRTPDRRPDGRLTDDERRNLHRDLDRANREIYNGRR